jgi:hypothetical protein
VPKRWPSTRSVARGDCRPCLVPFGPAVTAPARRRTFPEFPRWWTVRARRGQAMEGRAGLRGAGVAAAALLVFGWRFGPPLVIAAAILYLLTMTCSGMATGCSRSRSRRARGGLRSHSGVSRGRSVLPHRRGLGEPRRRLPAAAAQYRARGRIGRPWHRRWPLFHSTIENTETPCRKPERSGTGHASLCDRAVVAVVAATTRPRRWRSRRWLRCLHRRLHPPLPMAQPPRHHRHDGAGGHGPLGRQHNVNGGKRETIDGIPAWR